MNKIFEKYSNLSISSVLLIVIILLIIFGAKVFGFSSDALLSLISAVIGGLIVTSSQAWVSAQDRENQLRLAALDKRLEVHQQAYYRWRRILFNIIDKKDVSEIVRESHNWWEENCLYLEPNASKSFYRAINSVSLYLSYLQNGDSYYAEKQMEFFQSVGEIIAAGVGLPTIGNLEVRNN